MSDSTFPVGIIRRHMHVLTAGPRPRLRVALDRARSTLEARFRRSRLPRLERPIEFIWSRPSPLLVLRENRVWNDWRISSTVLVSVARPIAAVQPDPGGRTGIIPSPGAAPVPRLTRTIERRLETRVVERSFPVVGVVNPQSGKDTARPTAPTFAAPPSESRPPVARIIAPIARSKMIFTRSRLSPPAAATVSAAHANHSDTLPLQRSTRPAEPQGAALRIERITNEVIRALDARLIAWRERMGRS